MKTVQKLEICSGIAVPIATLVYIYFGFLRFFLERLDFKSAHFQIGITQGEMGAIILFAVVFLFSSLLAFGAYYHAKGSEIAAEVLNLGGLVTIVLLGFWGFRIIKYGGLFYGALVFSPVILSALTIILAFFSKEKDVLTIK
jgi:hypothetical protein